MSRFDFRIPLNINVTFLIWQVSDDATYLIKVSDNYLSSHSREKYFPQEWHIDIEIIVRNSFSVLMTETQVSNILLMQTKQWINTMHCLM